jgi:hypothetical protein
LTEINDVGDAGGVAPDLEIGDERTVPGFVELIATGMVQWGSKVNRIACTLSRSCPETRADPQGWERQCGVVFIKNADGRAGGCRNLVWLAGGDATEVWSNKELAKITTAGLLLIDTPQGIGCTVSNI